MAVESNAPRLTIPVSEHDHTQGRAGAKVTLVEYGDYECPHCGRAHPIIKEVIKSAGVELRFVFRNFPLAQIHKHSQHAAEAAAAAGAQGKFWEMHDHIFKHQQTLDDAHLVQFAAELGLDATRVENELTQGIYADRVRDDFRGGIRSGVNGTPTFFINGVRYDGALDFDDLLSAIERAKQT
ncbi:MAG: DsbA family protein [Pyrinomonadaceae bacterium]